MKLVIFSLMVSLTSMSFTPTASLDIITYDESTRIKTTKEILGNLVEEQYEAVQKNFHATLKQSLPAEKISEIWTTIISNYGTYKEVVSIKHDVFQGYNQIKIRCQFEKERATLEATFTEDDKVIAIYIRP